jgi:phage-related baseplate assembly protein
MPFNLPQPTIADFLEMYRAGVRGVHDRFADVREGAAYEHIGGLAAILWSREVQYDEDAFDALYFATADGDDLTDYALQHFQKARVLDTPGIGTATFTRTTVAGATTINAGTRIMIGDVSGRSEPIYYEVSHSTPVTAFESTVMVPIRATFPGPSSAFGTSRGSDRPPSLADVLQGDWRVDSLSCSAGTTFEAAPDFRARVQTERRASRVGYLPAFRAACQSVGATHIEPFASDFGGDANDVGLNVIYVSDDSFDTPPSLVTACTVALESVRLLGDQLQVRPMTTEALSVVATITLHDQPANYNIERLRARLTNALTLYLSQSFAYSRDEMAGAMIQASSAIQDVSFLRPTVDVGILRDTGGLLGFPDVLTRYTLDPLNITLTFVGPT